MDALIVGATGGLGCALIKLLAAQNTYTKIFAAARRPAEGVCTSKVNHTQVEHCRVDVGCEASIAECADYVAHQSQKLSLIVYAAGVLHGEGMSPERKLEQIQKASFEDVFKVNTLGAMLVAKHFFPLLKHDTRAVFACISARVGSIEDNRMGGWYAYRSSKAALNMFVKTMSQECQRRAPNLICLALHPGTVDTALSKPFQRAVPAGKLFSPEYAAECLVANIDRATPKDSGSFWAWDGQKIAW